MAIGSFAVSGCLQLRDRTLTQMAEPLKRSRATADANRA